MNNRKENNITIPNSDLYEVTKEQYKAFVQQLKPEIKDIRVRYDGDGTIYTEVYSNLREVKLCSRIGNIITEAPEKYYIWELSNAAESQRYIPRKKVVLEDPKQVQILLDYIREQNKK